MTVYVDDMRMQARVGRLNARWSHLIADTEDELHAFAGLLGLQRSWFQQPKGLSGRPEDQRCLQAQHWHYDVTSGKREQAIRLGAVPVTVQQLTEIIGARWHRLHPGAAAEHGRRVAEITERGRTE